MGSADVKLRTTAAAIDRCQRCTLQLLHDYRIILYRQSGLYFITDTTVFVSRPTILSR